MARTRDPEHAIIVENVSKDFILHHNRSESLKARFIGLFKERWRQRDEAFHALRDVSFKVRRGEAIGLLGHNGSGKSTLLHIIAGILKPTQGRVITHGRVAPMIELGVGFNPDLTGEENIYLNASLYGFRNADIRRRVPRIVEFSELGEFIDVPVKNYSSGMYARLGFSVAIHLDPEILLADEILAVGDADFQTKCKDRIREMRTNGLTIVLVSHSHEQVKELCNQYIRLEKGTVIEQGSLTPEPGTADARLNLHAIAPHPLSQ